MGESIEDIKQRIRAVQHKEPLFDRVIRRLKLNLTGIVFEEELKEPDYTTCDTNGQHED
jgi:hypothetical protein